MNRKHTFALAGCLMLALVSADCKDKPGTPAQGSPELSSMGSKTFTGKVVETMDAATYTYVLVDTGKEKLWAAGPQTPMKVGDSVTVTEGMPMAKYHSKTLNRDFDVVYFAGSLQGSGAGAAVGQAQPKLPPGHPPIGTMAAKPKVDLAGIKKDKGGYTIQEIFAAKAALKGKEVTVRGRVVKYSAMIMGKNWLHVQDGTGAEGSNDLTVTAGSSAKVGDTVLVKGIVSCDKDLGYGYKFPVIIEDAKVVVE
jgi:hypothetical protein